jgi:hypothetical protein
MCAHLPETAYTTPLTRAKTTFTPIGYTGVILPSGKAVSSKTYVQSIVPIEKLLYPLRLNLQGQSCLSTKDLQLNLSSPVKYIGRYCVSIVQRDEKRTTHSPASEINQYRHMSVAFEALLPPPT